jgi:alcohol dehydrogenase class IV
VDIYPFSIARLPQIVFGDGVIRQAPAQVARFGRHALIVTGGRAFRGTPHWPALLDGLRDAGVGWETLKIEGEPSPQVVDDAVDAFRRASIDVVLAIGGGSVLDAAKAIAGLLPHGNSVLDHLEGVGRNIPYHGPATPLIAAPTTAGTGSEATKNAVLSVQGPEGFKKSFRHDVLVPQLALVDPELLASCPPALIVANGMDAFTQLLESYVSLRANPFTDALAVSGMQAVKEALFPAWRGGGSDEAKRARAQMAYGSLLSGITLAQVGLGSVHGLASPLGAFFPIPHGVVCGTLLAAATDANIRALRERAPSSPALKKYADIGFLLTDTSATSDLERGWQFLSETLRHWTEQLGIARLGAYGVTEGDMEKVVANSRGSSMQTNPIVLTDGEVGGVVRERL